MPWVHSALAIGLPGQRHTENMSGLVGLALHNGSKFVGVKNGDVAAPLVGHRSLELFEQAHTLFVGDANAAGDLVGGEVRSQSLPLWHCLRTGAGGNGKAIANLAFLLTLSKP